MLIAGSPFHVSFLFTHSFHYIALQSIRPPLRALFRLVATLTMITMPSANIQIANENTTIFFKIVLRTSPAPGSIRRLRSEQDTK